MNDETKEDVNEDVNDDAKEDDESEEFKDRQMYQYDEESDSFIEIKPSKVPKIPVINEEIKHRLSTYRNSISEELPHRPELSVLTTILLETAMNRDVSEVVEGIKDFYRNLYA